MTEFECNLKILEQRQEEIQESLVSFEKLGKDGIAQLMRLPGDSPVRLAYFRKKKNKSKYDIPNDRELAQNTVDILKQHDIGVH